MLKLLLAAAGVALLLLGGAASPAAAHSDDGLMLLESRSGEGPLEPRVVARVTYLNDGHPASGATVTVDAVGSDAAVLPPVVLTEVGDGMYEAAVALPAAGTWTLRATATTPAATADTTYIAPAPATATTRPVVDREPTAGREAEPDAVDDSDAGVVAISVLAVVIVAALAVGVSRSAAKRNRSGNTSTN